MKKFKICLVLCVLMAFLLISIANAAQPGDATDPLVTRRFVEDRLATITAEIAQLRNIVMGITPNTPAATPSPVAPPPLPSLSATETEDVDELFALVMYYFETVYGERLDAALAHIPGPVGDPFAPRIVPFEILNPKAGEKIIFDASAEFILRGGSATAITGINGIANVTTGTDVLNGESIGLNNLMMVPVSDGRGIVFQRESWLMVRGGYTIE